MLSIILAGLPPIIPNGGALPGQNVWVGLAGGVMFYALLITVLIMIGSAVLWAGGTALFENPMLASRGKVGVIVSFLVAVIIGAAEAIVVFAFNAGQGS